MAFKIRGNITDSFWFTPLVMGAVGLVLAQTMVYVDMYLIRTGMDIPFYGLGADGGRGILIAIAGSVLGVAATSFSITTSVLATASSTYGPRLVRNFMADSRNQFVLGSFGASFLYALMVLRSIRDTADVGMAFVPSLSINLAIAFGVMNVVLLIYFIHHIADSIQISTLVSRVRDDLIKSIESLYPVDKEEEKDPDEATRSPFSDALPVAGSQSIFGRTDGFVTWIDYNDLAERARDNHALLKLLVQPGDYVFMGMVVAELWQPKEIDPGQSAWPQSGIYTSQTRTPYQDIRYAVQQPVDITIRALSPGINDPYTAINALHGLGSGLTRLCQRKNADPVVFDADNKARLHKRTITIEHMLESVFRTLRANVINSVDATLAVLELAQNVLNTTDRESYRNIVVKAVHTIDDAFMDSDSPQADKEIIKNASMQIIKDHTIDTETLHEPIVVEEAKKEEEN